jgi:hypothetical protein
MRFSGLNCSLHVDYSGESDFETDQLSPCSYPPEISVGHVRPKVVFPYYNQEIGLEAAIF